MENATEALKMAGAMLIFVVALSVTIMAFSKAREASGSIMEYSDRSRTFYNIENPSSEREVKVDAVIANLYNAYQSQETIVFYTGKKEQDGKITSINPVTLYYTECLDKTIKENSSTLKESTLNLEDEESNSNYCAIYGIDTSDEVLRDEPWQFNDRTQKQFIDALINRKLTPPYAGSRNLNNLKFNMPVIDGKNKLYQIGFAYNFDSNETSLMNLTGTFIERIGIYNTDRLFEKTDNSILTNSSSSIIGFEEIDETIENESGTKHKVIEYIYIGDE